MDLVTSEIPQDNLVKMTKDYDRFQRVKGNRKIYPTHVANLVEAFTDNPDILSYNPILVNEKMEVIDGQHRLEAARKLDIPVYYIQQKKLGIHDVQALNSYTKPWGPTDYALSYAELGKVDYQLYLEMLGQFPIGHDMMRHILSQGQCSYGQFKAGRFQIFRIKDATTFLEKLFDFAEYFGGYKDRSFVVAFEKMCKNEEYHHEHMVRQLSTYSEELIDHYDTAEYLRELEGIYNAGAKPQSTIRFF